MNDPINNCQTITELLDAYHDGELEPAEKELVMSHLQDCQPCNKQLQDIKNLVTGIKSIASVKPARDIISTIDFSKLDNNSETIAPATSKVLLFSKKIWLGLGAVAAIALVFINFGSKQANLNDSFLANSNNNSELAANIGKKPIPTRNVDTSSSEDAAIHINKNKKLNDSKTNKQQLFRPALAHNTETQYDLDSNNTTELASIDLGDSAGTETLGIATDEDGLYEIKI